MQNVIRVSTRADQFEKRKKELLEAGYRILEEQAVPFNGMCSLKIARPSIDEDTAG